MNIWIRVLYNNVQLICQKEVIKILTKQSILKKALPEPPWGQANCTVQAVVHSRCLLHASQFSWRRLRDRCVNYYLTIYCQCKRDFTECIFMWWINRSTEQVKRAFAYWTYSWTYLSLERNLGSAVKVLLNYSINIELTKRPSVTWL